MYLEPWIGQSIVIRFFSTFMQLVIDSRWRCDGDTRHARQNGAYRRNEWGIKIERIHQSPSCSRFCSPNISTSDVTLSEVMLDVLMERVEMFVLDARERRVDTFSVSVGVVEVEDDMSGAKSDVESS
jgi:hypothetical protein